MGKGLFDLSLRAAAVASMHAQRLAEQLFDVRLIRFIRWQREILKGQICRLNRPGKRRDVVCLRGWDVVRQLLGPKGVDILRLLLSHGCQEGVGPDEPVVSVEERVVAVPGFGSVFGFGDVVPALAVAAEE